jgi:transcriptional regulator with XRE-family HTH domain
MQLQAAVAKNIKALRLKAGLTQEQLADKTGLNKRYLSQLETQPQNLTLQTLETLAHGLDVPVGELVRGDDERAKAPSKRSLPGLDEAIQVLQGYRSLAD